MATKLKTNKAMRLGSVMLVLALLTTCAISGTFAKYTTSATASDTARVAQWGFGESSTIEMDLFNSEYTNVQSSDGTNVIAPGTSGEATFEFVASDVAPEVAYTLAIKTDKSSCDSTIQNNKNIKWYLDGKACTNWTDLTNKIKALSGNSTGSKSYAAGEKPDSLSGEHTIKWEWVYSTADAQDKADTAMGNAETPASVTLNIELTATQVD